MTTAKAHGLQLVGFLDLDKRSVLSQCNRWQLARARELAQRHPDCDDAQLTHLVHASLMRRLAAHDGCTPELLIALREHLLACAIHRNEGVLRVGSARGSRKRAGAFYTPDCVVDYIVNRAIAAHGPQTVLDPACGAGRFLLAAYRRLVHGHIFQAPTARKMSQSPACERLDLLARCIYGADVDPLAVETAREALLLAALEGQPVVDASLIAAARSALERHVVWGDALVEPSDPIAPDAAPALNWRTAMPEVFDGAAPGFDVVLGNPPYRRERQHKAAMHVVARSALGRRHRAPRMDLWYYFVHRALELWLRQGGTLSLVVNSYATSGRGSARLVEHIRRASSVQEVFDLGDLPIFPGVRGRHMIFRLVKGSAAGPVLVRRAAPTSDARPEAVVRDGASVVEFAKTAEQLYHRGGLDLLPPADALLEKLAAHPPLAELGLVRQGIAENPAAVDRRTNARFDGRFSVGQGVFALRPEEVEALHLAPEERAVLRPYHDLVDLGRYRLADVPSRVLIYSTKATWPEADRYPRLLEHLARFRAILEARRETRLGRNRWWHLHWPRDERLWQSAKIAAVQMARRPSFVPAERPVYVPFSVNVFVPGAATGESIDYLTALLNSRLMWTWYEHHAKRRGVGLEINGHVLARTPIRRIDFHRADQRRLHDELAAMVRHRMTLAEPDRIEQQERVIDRRVYALYGITDEEVAQIESSM